jgi:glycerophosphoryl diester phosphodiesterase
VPLVIAHRGASGYRPEHTLAGYELAARMGADYLEPDLVSTADGVLVARHEPMIGGTTDVAAHPEFADRRTQRVVDGVTVEDWFADDFTLAELRTLRAVERLPALRQGNTVYDGLFTVPTLDEILALRARLCVELGREIGVYPETKNPSYLAGRGLACEPALVAALRAHGLDRPDAPVFIQSFETANLRALQTQTPVRLIQLMDAAGAPADLVAAGDPRTYADLAHPAELAAIAEYAAGIGPAKELVLGPDGVPTGLVDAAHAVGLLVHAYTFRNENAFLPAGLRRAGRDDEHGDVLAEYRAFVDAGVDGLFTDHPDTAVAALSLVLA